MTTGLFIQRLRKISNARGHSDRATVKMEAAMRYKLNYNHEMRNLIEALIQRGRARDLGESPRFRSQLNEEFKVGGAQVSVDLLAGRRLIRTFPNRPAGNMRPLALMAPQNEVTVERSMKDTGCFIMKGQYQATKHQERLQKLRDCKHFLYQDRRFQEVTRLVETVEPGPERVKVIDDFWKDPWEEREMLRIRGKVLAEHIGLLEEERSRRSLCERSSGPSHVEDGGGDAQRLADGMHRSSAVTDGPSSQGSSMVGTESVPGLGLTSTCVASGHPLQT
jgi:hypothetical protein